MTDNEHPAEAVPLPPGFAAQTSAERFAADCTEAAADPEGFWRRIATRLDWITPPTRIRDVSLAREDLHIRWYDDGVLNASLECLDRHLATRGDKPALVFEPDDPATPARTLSYRQVHAEVCRLANALRHLGIGKGDRVTLYLPMTPEAVIAMLACARIGAVHSVVFGGFAPQSIADRIRDCGSRLVITADSGRRGGKPVPLKANVDAALQLPGTTSVETVLVLRHTGDAVPMQMPRDRWWHALLEGQPTTCPAEPMGAEDPLFILYTSGSTGKPKGVLHTTGGYLVYAAYTHALLFDLREDDVYWCTADVGWITGHSYITYGPLANGATCVVFEGVPTWPDAGRFWQVVDRHAVSLFYTAPTALRALMREGDGPVKATSRTSLRLLGSVGEPINPEAWRWYFEVVGEARCPIVDTWWQTETGGVLISPVPGTRDRLKPGAATQALPGIEPALMDADGRCIEGEGSGTLVITNSWPGQMRTVYGDHARFVETYFSTYPGLYFTGDGARRDADGDWWITGRVDDVINVSGHRIGTAEVESALVAHPKVAEAAVVGVPHPIKGQALYAFVTPMQGVAADAALAGELRDWVRRDIGPIATPDGLQFATALPKTRSGKIMRRILRKIAEGQVDQLGDISTLADPAVVAELLANRRAVG